MRRDGGQLTGTEVLNVQAIAAGTYFVENETPSGTINGVNTVFTLANTPNPTTSLELTTNGALQKAGGVDFTLSGNQITYVNAPPLGSIHLANYRRAL